VAVERQEDVVELQITVDDSVLVEVFERQADFRSVESALNVSDGHSLTSRINRLDLLSPLGTELPALDVQHQVTTRYVLHHKVNPRFRLEACVQIE